MEKLKQIYEGKAKILYETDDVDLLIQEFKDNSLRLSRQLIFRCILSVWL